MGPRASRRPLASIALAALAILALLAPAPAAADTDPSPLDLPGVDGPLGASDGSGAGAKARGRRWLSLRTFRGSVASEGRLYLRGADGDLRRGQLIQTLRGTVAVKLLGAVDLFVRPRFVIDALDVDLHRYEPLEAYVAFGAQRWSLRLGQFVDNWGVADALNPLDVLNRRDYGVDLVDPPRLGELGARLQVHLPGGRVFGQPTLSAYVMPLWRDPLFATSNNRFSLAQPQLAFERDATKPGVADSLFAALRFEHTLNTPLFAGDLQYVVARGPDRVPNLVLRPGATPTLAPEVYGSWTFGAGFRVVPKAPWWSKLTLKGELAYRRPYRLEADQALPDDYLQYAVGFDRVISGVITRNDQLTVTLEYLGEHLAGDTLARFRPFEHDVAMRLHYQLGNFARSVVMLRGIVDVTNAETVLEASYQQQLRVLHDDLRVALRGQVFLPRGGDESLFALFPNNSNLRLELRFAF